MVVKISDIEKIISSGIYGIAGGVSMHTQNYLRVLVEEIHSAAVATLDKDGRPQNRIIDMMLWDKDGVYFLTAKGKEFYSQLMEQKYISLAAVKDKKSITLKGEVINIGKEKLDIIFESNLYMKEIYPHDTRSALEVFWICKAQGEYFDISNPAHVVRDSIVIGMAERVKRGYYVRENCTGCGVCHSVCPQNCIDVTVKPAVIKQNRCLHCGRCLEYCPHGAIERRR